MIFTFVLGFDGLSPGLTAFAIKLMINVKPNAIPNSPIHDAALK